MTYAERLKDPRWQRKRLEILNRDNFTCQECGSPDKTLHVHHRRYQHGMSPWEYPKNELVTLCEDCHARETERDQRLNRVFAEIKWDGAVDHVIGYAMARMAYYTLSPVDIVVERMDLFCMYEFAQGVATFFDVTIKAVIDALSNSGGRIPAAVHSEWPVRPWPSEQ